VEKRRQESDAKRESITALIMRPSTLIRPPAGAVRAEHRCPMPGNPAAGVVLFKILMKLSFYQSLPFRGAPVLAQASWRKCHKKAKNVRARFDSNLPSCGNAYKQISELSVGGISVQL
jgi:hypothetical protein